MPPDVAGDDDHDGDQGDEPVLRAVLYRGLRQGQPDGDNDRPRDDGRKISHDTAGAKGAKCRRQQEVDQPRTGNPKARIGQKRRVALRCDRRVACQEGKGGAQEGGHLPLCDHVEQQRAHPRKEERRADAEPRQKGHQDGGPEHGEQVLHAQDQHPAHAKGPGVVDGLIADTFHFPAHRYSISFQRQERPRKTEPAPERAFPSGRSRKLGTRRGCPPLSPRGHASKSLYKKRTHSEKNFSCVPFIFSV